MNRYFVRDTPLADLERQMMAVPNFAPRGHGRRVLCSYRPTAADVGCRYCLQYGRRHCQSRTCPYLAERLEAGAVTMEELIAEAVRAWKHLPLKQRALSVARRANSFLFEGTLHVVRMMDVVDKTQDYADSTWLAAVYLLSAYSRLWELTSNAISVRLNGLDIQDYVLYRAAKGIFHGTLGTTSEELADPELVSDDTLLLVLNAAIIARYGPQVMRVGRIEKC